MNPVLHVAQRLGLKRNLMFGYALLLGFVALLMFVALNLEIRGVLERSLTRRGAAVAEHLSTGARLPLLQQDAEAAERLLNDELADEDVAYAAIVDAETGRVLAEAFGAGHEVDRQGLIARRLKNPEPGMQEGPDALHFTRSVTTTRLALAPFDTPAAEEELLLGDSAVAPQQEETGPEVIGWVLVAMSKDPVGSALADLNTTMLVVVVVGMALFVLLSIFITRWLVMRPINSMKTAARRLSDYDLTGRSEKFADDELGEMSDAMNRIGENLHRVITRAQGVTGALASVAEQVAKTSESVAGAAETTAAGVDQTGSSMQEMLASLKGIAENVEILAQSAEESSSSILEMAATNDEVAQNVASLAASVEETTTAIEQMTYSIKEVAKNVEDLSATSEQTSSAMNEMDVSISQVESNANETARLSEQVSADARTAGDALKKTIDGIGRIRDSSRTAADVIEALGQKIATIGNILNVIDDVAEQTNLLALNAAIIAAQAGEHGKGFAVVADEIKDLAERTGASTKEIADLIRSVQDESKNAVAAMERGVQAVDEGVQLSGDADRALQQILASAGRSTDMVKEIAKATVEQSKGSREVTTAINRIAETVQEIARATAEQAQGSEQIMKQAERMKIITKHVERSSHEQARGSKQITQAIENISEMVQQLNRAQKEQTKGAEQVMLAVENIKEVADHQTGAVKDLESTVDTLSEQAELLANEVRRFRV